ncbi:hypothetical protein VTN31DRAFT_479 [Thermomyces dupontii]|uniref:uncharacterized protein n=1 Tax=Talaromyces thermophilus TaxID=28565 RepID=UPI00374392B8
MAGSTVPLTEKFSKQACDNCRRRKIKCNRAYPSCDKCDRLLLSCSYKDVLQRKGPKFRTVYPKAPLHPLAARVSMPTGEPASGALTQETQLNPPSAPPSSSSSLFGSQPSPESLELLHEPHPHQRSRPFPRRLSSLVLLAHVHVYLKYLYPIMPVIRPDEVLRDSEQPEKLSPQRYAFMAALCAATHVQLRLDGTNQGDEGSSNLSGEDLLMEAVAARRECDPAENASIESLLTSFFLFATYGNLDRQDQAWFYLSQAIAMAHTLGLHREATYARLDPAEAEEQRKVFWLLFVTERAYALQRAKPILLRSSIRKPRVMNAEDSVLDYGFLNLIRTFEKLKPDLYDWVAAGYDETIVAPPATSEMQQELSQPIPVDGVTEIQHVDIMVTQQWLQAMMWKLSMMIPGSDRNRVHTLLPFHLPVLVGKTLLDFLGSVSQGAIDAHGIGMEQKLYDMGTAIADMTESARERTTQRLADTTADPKDLLWGILNVLSCIRGARSYLFPSLLQRSSSIFNLESPSTLTNTISFPASSKELPYHNRPAALTGSETDEESNQTETSPSIAEPAMQIEEIEEDVPLPPLVNAMYV